MDTIIHIKSKKGIFIMEENKEMLSNEDNKNNTAECVDTDNGISVTLCNGVTYLLDSDAFDWDELSSHKDILISNENTIMQMLHDLISLPDTDAEECKELINKVTETVDEFGASFKIEFDYSAFKLSDREIALIKCFDALNVVNTITREIKVYDAGFSAVKSLFESINNVSHYRNDNEETSECCCDDCCCNNDDADVSTIPDIPKDELDAMFSALNGLDQTSELNEIDMNNIFMDIEESDNGTSTEKE